MQKEIQNLIAHPEAIREELNIDQLSELIRNATAIWGQSITMRYSVREGRTAARFDAEAEQDLVSSSGIFSNVLIKCRIDTFGSEITYTPEDGFKVWFTLHLSYQHFEGGENGMNIASFRFENRKWTMFRFKGKDQE